MRPTCDWVLHLEEGFCSYEVTMEEDGVYVWEESMGNTKRTQPCLSTQGNATRNCLTGGLWTPVNFVECIMRELTCVVICCMCEKNNQKITGES